LIQANNKQKLKPYILAAASKKAVMRKKIEPCLKGGMASYFLMFFLA
jgi:hypothetical protein